MLLFLMFWNCYVVFIVNNGTPDDDEGGRYSCVHTSGSGHSDGAKVTLDGVTMESKGVAAIKIRHPPPLSIIVSSAEVPLNVKVFPAKSRLTSTLLDVVFSPITKASSNSTSSVKVTFTFVSGYLFATLTASKMKVGKGDSPHFPFFKFTYNGKAYEETKVVTLTAGHTVEYVYGIETLDQNGKRTNFQTQDTYTAATTGVTHHRAKCSVCGLYLDNDYVKHSYTEYVNVQATGDAGYNRFAAVCECGHQILASNEGAKNLRKALDEAAKNGVPVVHIVAPYWEVKGATGAEKLGGIHIHFSGSDTGNDAGEGAIKVPAGVTNFFDFEKWGQSPFTKMKRAGTLAVSNTTINYTKKLPAANAEVCKAVGASLKADGGALFVKLLNQTTGKYLGDNEKVKVTLTNVTATTEDKAEGQNAPYGIYIDDNRSIDKNLEVSGDTSVTDNSFVSYKAAGAGA